MFLNKNEVYKAIKLNNQAIEDPTNPEKQKIHKKKKKAIDRFIDYFNEKFSVIDEIIENIDENNFKYEKEDLQLNYKKINIIMKKNIYYGKEEGYKSSDYIIYIKYICSFYTTQKDNNTNVNVHFDSRLMYKINALCKSAHIENEEKTKLYKIIKDSIQKYINEKMPFLFETFKNLIIVKNYINSLIRGMSQKKKNEAFNLINTYNFNRNKILNEDKLKEIRDILLMSMDIKLKRNLDEKLK